MLYEGYAIEFIETSKLSDYHRQFGILANGFSWYNQDKAIKYPWVAVVDSLRIYHTTTYRPGLVWCEDFAVGAQTPKEALQLAKYNIDMRIKTRLSQGLDKEELKKIRSRSIDRHCKKLVKKIQAKHKQLKEEKNTPPLRNFYLIACKNCFEIF